VVALWIPYTLLNLIFPGPIATYTWGLALAGMALGLLWLAGIPPQYCFVRAGLASRQGARVLLALSIYVPIALVAVGGHPWNWIASLIYAPASAIAQELYFRAALLSSLIQLNPKRPVVAVLLQALLFALWHARAFEVVSIAPALAVLAAVFIAGALWGWQVRHDRTVIYAAVEHTLFLAIV
jgi:membrane protease YdiL (CAAX protease family)